MQDIIRANYEMTAEECDLYVKLFQKAESDQRFYLLKIREEKGWKAKGFESFECFGKAILGIEKTQLYSLAKAGEVQLSLPDSANCGKLIPEGQLRPLAPLTDDERRQVWNEATAKAEADQKKLTAKMVQEAVDRLTAEKAEIQSKLELTEQGHDQWRSQAIAEKKAKAEAEQKAQIAQGESASLRRTLATEAEKLAEALILETRLEVSHAREEASKLKESIKTLKREREDAIQRGVQNKLREQQDEINRKEAQLQTIESKIATQAKKLANIDSQDVVYTHFKTSVESLKKVVHALTDEFREALDQEKAPFLPTVFVKEFERMAMEIEQGATGLRQYLNQVDIRQLEVLVNE